MKTLSHWASGNITPWSVMKDPDAKVIYFTFKIEPGEMTPDLMVVYFYDSEGRKFIMKMLLSL